MNNHSTKAVFSQLRFLRNTAIIPEQNVMNADYLNALQIAVLPDFAYRFIDQDMDEGSVDKGDKQQDTKKDERYYEHIIYEDKCIPTRSGSAHDYFNGLMWLHYPQCKAWLNTLHWQDISQNGHKQRSAVRDRVTHFDECGMVLVTDISDLKERIAAHDWHWLFVDQKDAWFRASEGIVPLHFGHANLELLCRPFIGLTAKALVIDSVDLLKNASELLRINGADLSKCSKSALPENETSKHSAQALAHFVDSSLLNVLKGQEVFQASKPFLPLPILGIPGWHFAEQSDSFYNNKNYFMPHRSARK